MRRFHAVVLAMILLMASAYLAFESNRFPLGVFLSFLFFMLPGVHFALEGSSK